ncbi:D-alanyl-D-alanine carboxypeptidase family protein [Haloimpatiens sp. FM7315]|uniref:D-alanyl-D-alanine carboxypeptidase family protein n=1 Tax=Haloimpatiens sp. FM7315 TaxID=3298609 RepID=UPI0035A2F2C8
MKHKKLSLIFTIIFMVSSCNSVFAKTNDAPPSINGSAAITLDVNTGEIIYTKDIDGTNYKKANSTKGMYPASTTKLMTALVFSKNKNKLSSDILKYNKSAIEQPKYSLYTDYKSANLKVGNSIPSQDVMNALLLYSANDMAYVVAGNVGKTSTDDENSKKAVNNFIDMMNKEAEELHMKNTHFVTANGLHDVNHYTTPYDLSLLGRAAAKDKWVSETIIKKKSDMHINNVTIPLENRNKLLEENINGAVCIGGKTGYTSDAGRCLVAIFNKNGHKIIGVVMNSIYDAKDSFVFEDMKKIIDWSYKASKVNYLKKDSKVKTVSLKYKPLLFVGPEKTLQVPLLLKENVDYYKNTVNTKEIKTTINTDKLTLNNLSTNKPVAQITVSEREAVKSYDLYTNVSKSQILKDNILLYSLVALSFIAVCALLIFISIYINKIKRRHSRRKNKYWS